MFRAVVARLSMRRCAVATAVVTTGAVAAPAALSTPHRSVAVVGGAALPSKLTHGVSATSMRTVRQDLDSTIPTLMLFYVTTNAEVLAYTEMVMRQLASVNSEKAAAGIADRPGGAPPVADGAPPAVRLLLADCAVEAKLAASMGVSPHAFPIVYFFLRGGMVDKIIGIVTEAQVREALHAFIQFGENAPEKQREVEDRAMKRMDPDDENPLSLLQAAQDKLKEKDIAKALQLFRKSAEECEVEVAKLSKSLNLRAKKLTPSLVAKLRQNSHYMTLPQALAGEAMALGVTGDWDSASRIVKRIRAEFAWAVQELRVVADAVVRIDIVESAGYDIHKDNYSNLMKKEEFVGDPVAFYRNNVKLAAAHYLERNHKSAIDECLRLIRAEPKLLPALKDAGVVGADVSLSLNSSTPARRTLFLIFEGLGNTHEDVIAARKKIAAFMCI